jgi:type III secretion system FlhB-like substrate exporter
MNPTEAAALAYPEGADAPFIAAKAKGDLAKRLLDIARENGIPVVADADLADVLMLSDIGDCIPPETYEALACIFAFLRKMEQRHG